VSSRERGGCTGFPGDRAAYCGVLLSRSLLTAYKTFMTTVLHGLRTRLRDDGYACLVIGDVPGENQSEAILQAAARQPNLAGVPVTRGA
jgi:hypothetical protein